ncbi:MAG TPA: dihydroorotate dehydrogenase-like protein [Gemmatimonadales bacterium]|nr:dihydroorotate dehydrogenase-like protein [Gemmatimonadales bacterium]
MIDLSTDYLGLKLATPLVAGASPLCEDVGNLRRLEDAGASAVVLHSLFEEQLTRESDALDRALSTGTDSHAEAMSYFPDLVSYNLGPEGYLEHIRKAKAALGVPVIASLNGVSSGGWVGYARKMEQAGADALELNVYFIPTDSHLTGAAVEQQYCELVRDVRAAIRIPLAVKVGHQFTAFANMARRLEEAGAGALVLFNRFYQPDLDTEKLEVVSALSLSQPYELLLRLHWVAVLYGRVQADLAVTGGVHGAQDVLKAMMAGANVAMMTSALLQRGIPHLAAVRRELEAWMTEHEYESVKQMRGSLSQRSTANPEAYERANYVRVLSSYALK